MGGPINLRQIELFKAVIEQGTVSRAAEVLTISQPAASKLLMQLEADHGLKLFDRGKGRLAPTGQAMRFYEEISRIFAGVRQVETAIAAIRREDQGQLLIGILPALAGDFIQRATMGFLKRNPNVYCSIQSLGSRWVAERVLTRRLDIGLVTSRIDNPSVVTQPLLEHPLVCIMPIGHALTRRKVIRPKHLDGIPFIAFDDDSYTGQKIAGIFAKNGLRSNVVMNASLNPTVCGFVAAGLGISLVHPLFIAGMENVIVARPFEPATPFDFLLCHSRDARNTRLVSEFVDETKTLAAELSNKFRRSWA
jgi:DNA-binding transcriptional LysR family regulator